MKIFVGNLSSQTTITQLQELFKRYGTVLSTHIFTDQLTGTSKGFAFVDMVDDAQARKAIEQLHGEEIDGKKLTVTEAKLSTGNEPASRIFIDNLSPNTSYKQLFDLFSKYGKVDSLGIMTDPFTEMPTGFAYVDMNNETEAQIAVTQLNNTMLNDQQITVRVHVAAPGHTFQ